LAAARAAVGGGAEDGALPVRDVLRAPAAGRVLAVHRRSEGYVGPGEPLLEIGDPERLEVRADVLSQDAVRIRPGTPVLLEQWGGDAPLRAVVWRVEPQGFTEVSSLGVEEQRTAVVAGLVTPPAVWASALGSGYRVLARFVVWEGRGVLQVPTSALFRAGDGWAVFVVEGGRAVRRPVAVGRQAGLAAQVVSGLREGETVVVHPGNELEDGVRVRAAAEE
ncbi:MAG TPA: HlyD family efflux transporter periplasmic adaptor subunit, partial [Longimicrobium sp.]|nr:HlyD family efflux transporter periplasmic adaptor subunit [Longimicrobium sp.]